MEREAVWLSCVKGGITHSDWEREPVPLQLLLQSPARKEDVLGGRGAGRGEVKASSTE